MIEPAGAARMRLDKWLWVARFFKTRSLAAEAIDGGKIKVNGHTVKRAREIQPGDRVDLTLGQDWRTVVIVGLAMKRRPAPEAQALYEETAESAQRRAAAAEARRLTPAPGADGHGRPTKRARRQLQRFFG